MKNKRGMSAVVTTLIIILLALVAIGVVWVVIKNIVSKGKEDISLTGLTLDLEILKASVDGDTLSVTVQRKSGEGTLKAISFIISDGDNSVVIKRETTMEELQTKTFTFDLSTELSGVGDITSISVAPVYETSSGKETTGEITDTKTYSAGSVGSGGEGPGGGGEECVPSCGEGYECVGGVCVESCTPNCIGRECGPDPVCGESCGICEGEEVCNSTGQCIPPEECTDTCETLGYECGTWEICGVEEDCGTCSEGICNATGQCYVATFVSSGTIDNVWPPGAGIYFDDSELPKTDGLYYGKAAYFPARDPSNCYLIVDYSYDSTIYENAIVELNLFGSLDIVSGDEYQIWDSLSECTDALS